MQAYQLFAAGWRRGASWSGIVGHPLALRLRHVYPGTPTLPLQEHRMELGKDVELGMYVASGIVVFDLHRKTIKWSQVCGGWMW